MVLNEKMDNCADTKALFDAMMHNSIPHRFIDTYITYPIARKFVDEAERRGRLAALEEVLCSLDELLKERDKRHPSCFPWSEEGDSWDALETDLRASIEFRIKTLK